MIARVDDSAGSRMVDDEDQKEFDLQYESLVLFSTEKNKDPTSNSTDYEVKTIQGEINWHEIDINLDLHDLKATSLLHLLKGSKQKLSICITVYNEPFE